MKLAIVGILIVAVLGIGGFVYLNKQKVDIDGDSDGDRMMQTSEQSENMQVSPTTAMASGSAMTVDEATNTVTVTVEGSNFKFVPAEIKVKKGQKVVVMFKNVGGFHDFVVDEFKAKTKQIKNGEEDRVEFVADKVGSFEYYCSVGEHREMGMVGKLIVE